jgi:hypothetical protein
MKHLLAATALAAVALAAPAAASAATFSLSPVQPCYGSGERVQLAGSGFTPGGSVDVSKDGTSLGATQADVNGAFTGVGLKLGRRSGRGTVTYTATDMTDPSLTASTQIVLSAVNVVLRPQSAAPGRRMRIRATGFTTGRTLWAHVIRGRSKRHIKLGRLRGACHDLTTRRQLLPRNARVGVYTVQFDAFRKYVKASADRRENSVSYTITVRRIFRPAALSSGWSRIF